MSHRRLDVLNARFRPAYVVWELTLACDQRCLHCGSRAAEARPDELSTEEALGVVRQLGAMGAREVVLIGGEAYLHEGFLEIIAAIRAAGVIATLTTGGRGLTLELCQKMAQAGLAGASVSVDGLGETHDRLRASKGGFEAATRAIAHLREAGLEAFANTNINRYNRGELEALYDHLRDAGIRIVAGAAHRAARPRRRQARSHPSALGSARCPPPGRRPQAARLRGRYPADAWQ